MAPTGSCILTLAPYLVMLFVMNLLGGRILLEEVCPWRFYNLVPHLPPPPSLSFLCEHENVISQLPALASLLSLPVAFPAMMDSIP